MEHKQVSVIRGILKRYWGYDSFRPLQEDIILSVLDGNDTLALLPTGGGKSICFQVPALALGGLCIVVSPLIALMKDQVLHLRERGIKAAALYSGMSHDQIVGAIQNVLFDPEYRFLYVSPERLQTETFKVNLAKMPVRMIAVDEAHCISQWGYDFRPPYLEIANIRKLFPHAPVLALTATATPEVVKDIQSRLDFPSENVFQKSFQRINLTYFVVKEEDKHGRLLRIIQRYPGTGIVYVRNRKKTAEVAEFLTKNGVPADYYNAGLDPKTRDRKQDDWMKGKIRVIVATNAFGMGIDKPDVRFVVHLDLPDTLEAYFQEAGRGGRDEKPSVAILLYDQNDIAQLKRSFTLSFPPLETVRNVYEHICQHFKIPMGEGRNTMKPFYLTEFAHALKMNVNQLFNALQLLEKTGVIVLSEHLREQSQVHFLMRENQLLEFEDRNPDLAEFVKTVLRSYGGIFTQFVNVDEKVLGVRCQMTEQEVVETLKRLRDHGVLSYQPQSNIPLLIFVRDRMDKDQIYFDPKVYADRKAKAEERLQSVQQYVTSDNVCRSRLLLSYFGETHSPACGQCDVCRRAANKKTSDNFQKLADQIKYLSQNARLDHKAIFEQLSTTYEEEEVADVMRWLIDQNEIF